MNYEYKENGWSVNIFNVVYPSDFAVYIEDDLIGYINASDIIDIRNDMKSINDFQVFSDVKNICGSLNFMKKLMIGVCADQFGFCSPEYLAQYYDLDEVEYAALKKVFDNPEIREDLDYFSDNYRYCIIGDEKSEKRYKELASRGCCGYRDIEIQIDKTRKAFFGFNYGH